jgi:hypothetical protein
MKIGIAVDNTIPLHIPNLVAFFEQHSKALHCHALKSRFHFDATEIEYEQAVGSLSPQLQSEANGFDLTLLITAVSYSNNYFYTGERGLYIVSLSDWHLLTTLPMSNGIAYMLCQIVLKYQMGIGDNHEEKTGCINDFWWDKTGVDLGMRAAFLCDKCRSKSHGNPFLNTDEFNEVIAVLDAVSKASRRGSDILLEPIVANAPGAQVSTFLCHNSQDKPQVRVLNETLKNAGALTWLDEEQIKPGEVWQDKLETTIASIGACLIIVGDSGFGPWQDAERRAFINEFSNRGCKVIPVLIGSPGKTPELPLFLKQFMWVDLRNDNGPQLARLIAALR